MDINAEILACFLDEAADSLAQWEKVCLGFHGDGTKDDFDALFRVAHNLKGASRAVGLDEFGAFVHSIEDVINLLRKDEILLYPGLSSILLDCQSVLLEWVESLRNDPTYVPDKTAIEKKIMLLRPEAGGMHVAATSTSTSDNSTTKQPEPVDELELLFQSAKAEADGNKVDAQVAETTQNQNTQPQAAQPVVTQKTEAKPKAQKDKVQTHANRSDETIRVAATKLDELIQLIGELSIHQSIVAQGRKANMLQQKTYQNAILMSSKITKEIQNKALSLRMQPLHGLFQRLERVGQDVARAQNKTVNIVVEGAEVELDKTVIERITDPLVHMMRNAIDHGVETDDERKSTSKPFPGTVKLIAEKDSAGVCIKIAEDGRGLNTEKLIKKAIAAGTYPEGAKVSDEEAWQLIFLPGLSTAEKVTDISGRGVGMDVVAKAVQALSGSIDVKSSRGQGTTMSITLPTTLSIVDALIVEIARSRYAVPMQELVEIVDLSNFSIETTNKRGRMISLRGKVVPVETLVDYLPIKGIRGGPPANQKAEKKTHPALVVREGSDMVVFEIDNIVSQQQVVVRALNEQLAHLPGFSGCTVLGDGEPGMIISLPEITRSFLSMTSRETRV